MKITKHEVEVARRQWEETRDLTRKYFDLNLGDVHLACAVVARRYYAKYDALYEAYWNTGL